MAVASPIFPASRLVRQAGNKKGNFLRSATHFNCQVHFSFRDFWDIFELGPGTGRVAAESLSLVKARLAAETDELEKKTYSGLTQLTEGNCGGSSPTYRTCVNSTRATLGTFNEFFIKSMVKLQLLGILTAMALGSGVGTATASMFPTPQSTERKLLSSSPEGSSIESHQPNRVEEADEDFSSSGVRQDHGVPVPTENDGDDEEARREFEELRAKPYAITVPLRIVGLRGSVPPVWLKDFMELQGKRVKLRAEFQSSLKSIFLDLSSALENKDLTPRSAMAADLVTIGDSWLGKAVSGGLIRPLENAEQFEWYQHLGAKWQTFVRRDDNGLIDPHGKVWGVPYRWGSLVIAYNHAKLQKHGIPVIKDWTDLWRPELAGKISMVASPREVVGAVLKALGASYNVEDFETDVPGGRQAMKEKFNSLLKQVRLFDDMQYLKTLGAGEVWVAVGWSGDVLPFAKRTSNITVITPQSGTSLWADLWAVPAATKIKSTKVGGRIRGPSPLIFQWFDFCLQPARANSFHHDVFVGASPLALSEREVHYVTREGGSGDNASSADLKSNSDYDSQVMEESTSISHVERAILSPEKDVAREILPPDVVAKSEFLEPLSEKALHDFKWLLTGKVVVRSSPAGLLDSLKGIMGRARSECKLLE